MKKYAIWLLLMADSPKLLNLIQIWVREHDGDVRFLTGSRNMAILRMHNKKYAIWPLPVAESPKFLHLNKEIGVWEHEGDVRFLTGSRNIGVSCIRNEKYAI